MTNLSDRFELAGNTNGNTDIKGHGAPAKAVGCCTVNTEQARLKAAASVWQDNCSAWGRIQSVHLFP